jgi:hypothetical protein
MTGVSQQVDIALIRGICKPEPLAAAFAVSESCTETQAMLTPRACGTVSSKTTQLTINALIDRLTLLDLVRLER